MAVKNGTKKPLIEFKHVNKIYPNGVQGLKDLNFTIGEGEFVIVIGLSGAGKSTMLRSINRLIDTTSGHILIDGKSITQAKGKDLRLIRRDIGMIFQNFNLVKRSSVLRNVLTGKVAYHPTMKTVFGLFPKEDKQLAYEALKRVNLAEKVYTRADELSGGQQQRVSIARALIQEPKIILADEPVASLDPVTTEVVMDDLLRINQDLGITVVVNLHSIELARKYGERIIGLRAGELVFNGSTEEATDSKLRAIYGAEILEEADEGEVVDDNK
jgi:phosphonate transport system ATP-binding protein